LTVINVANGLNFTINADALAALTSQPFYRGYSDPYPDFDAAEVNPVGHFIVAGKTYRATFARGLDAVSAALTKTSAESEYILDVAPNSATDWVVTLPMRRFIRTDAPAFIAPTTYPVTTGGYAAGMDFHPRDGGGFLLPYGCGTICPNGNNGSGPRLPWASTVASFRRSPGPADPLTPSAVLGSANVRTFYLLSGLGESGSAIMDFDPLLATHVGVPFQGNSIRLSDGAIASENALLLGVPAVGFLARAFQNGQLQCGNAICQGNYGGVYSHKWSLSVASTASRQ
jgi:hypothetical protein